MPDAVKYFDYDDYLLVDRSDIKTELETLSGGEVMVVYGAFVGDDESELAFRSDENFFIRLDNGAVIAYYDDSLMNTLVGDLPEMATVTHIFQVLRPPTSTQFRNAYSFDDSPLEASIQYIDTTREYVVRS